MELLGLAILMFLARAAVDGIHAVKGTTPAHVEKARLKAQQRAANGKPTFGDVIATFWGDAMADTIDSHNRRRAEKRRQREEAAAAAAEGREPRQTRPSLKARAKRLWHLLITPVGEGDKPAGPSGGPQPATAVNQNPATRPAAPHAWLCPTCGLKTEIALLLDRTWPRRCLNCGSTRPDPHRQPEPSPGAQPPPGGPPDLLPGPNEQRMATPPRQTAEPKPTPTKGDPMTAPTGEAANYETALAELDALEAAQREHLEQATAALKGIQDVKQRIADAQASYRPAAEAAGNIHQSLEALHLDQETIANTGTIVDSMPPNAVDAMFAQLEEMEAAAQRQVANAEAALAATLQARVVLIAKYGDAHNTVQSELGGDPTFLGAGGAPAAPAFDHQQPVNPVGRQEPNPAAGQENPQPVGR